MMTPRRLYAFDVEWFALGFMRWPSRKAAPRKPGQGS